MATATITFTDGTVYEFKITQDTAIRLYQLMTNEQSRDHGEIVRVHYPPGVGITLTYYEGKANGSLERFEDDGGPAL